MISSAAHLILRGGTVVYPTETVYGIGASVFLEKAVTKVFRIKQRPWSMPLSVAVSSFSMLERVAEVEKSDLLLLKALLPGPVTVLIKRSPDLPEVVTSGSELVGIRYPDHPLALELIEIAGPITSTSANLTGSPPPASVDELDPKLVDRVDLVLDGGRCSFAQPSTLVDLTSRKVIREGAGIDRVRKAMEAMR